MKKKLLIVGGANGVGKTTFAYQYKNAFGIEYLGADEIATELAVSSKDNIEVKAGKEFFKRLDNYLAKNKSVIIESTLSGTGLSRRIKQFISNGYSIHLVYVFLTDVKKCKKRVSFRVKKGGHNVPAIDIQRRYFRSLKNFWKVYAPLANEWQLFYNGFERPVEVAIFKNSIEIIADEDLFHEFKEISK